MHETTNNNATGSKRWYWLLTIPYLAILWVPSYNRIEPAAFGIPFYYWYQLLWVVLSTLIIAIVLKLAHGRKPVQKNNSATNKNGGAQ